MITDAKLTLSQVIVQLKAVDDHLRRATNTDERRILLRESRALLEKADMLVARELPFE